MILTLSGIYYIAGIKWNTLKGMAELDCVGARLGNQLILTACSGIITLSPCSAVPDGRASFAPSSSLAAAIENEVLCRHKPTLQTQSSN